METRTAATAPTRPADPVVFLVRLVVVATTLCGLMLAAAFLVRRLAGGFSRPLDASILLPVGIMLAMIALATRFVWVRTANGHLSVRERWIVSLIPTLTLALFACSLMLPGSSWVAIFFFVTILVAEETFALRALLRGYVSLPLPFPLPWISRPQQTSSHPSSASEESVAFSPVMEDATESRVEQETGTEKGAAGTFRFDSPHDSPGPPTFHVPTSFVKEEGGTAGAGLLEENVTQQLTRAQDEAGADILFGLLRGRFIPQQRSIRLHVAFCPPFEEVPEVSASKTDGPDVQITVGQVLAYGVRLDLRRGRVCDESQEVTIELFVQGKEPQNA